MSSLILGAAARILVSLMVLFSVYLLVRGHNEPGGGFVGGLVASTAFALIAISQGAAAVRKALVFQPLRIAVTGLGIAILSGLVSVLGDAPFLTGLWWQGTLPLGTPLLFDLGVYLAVGGAVLTVLVAMEEED